MMARGLQGSVFQLRAVWASQGEEDPVAPWRGVSRGVGGVGLLSFG